MKIDQIMLQVILSIQSRVQKYIDETSPGSLFLYQNFTYLSFHYAYIYDSVYESYRTKEFLYNIKFELIIRFRRC